MGTILNDSPTLSTGMRPLVRVRPVVLLAVALLAVFLPAVPLRAAAGDEPAAEDGSVLDREHEVRDPFFAFFIQIAESDSCGVWMAEDIRRYMDEIGRESRLPFDHIKRVVRRPAEEHEVQSRRGRKITRIWEVTLEDDLKLAMPYSILGYHPGSLIISRDIRLSEWNLGEPNFHVADDGEVVIYPSEGLTTFRMDDGWVVLDVDGWLDRLLGKKLDDAWTRGFSFCRVEGKLYGVALGVAKGGRNHYGEFDFAEDKVLPHGRPVAKGMYQYVKPWVMPPDGEDDPAWDFGEDR